MPRLDERLKTVAKQIRCRVHADIGSDHAYLLKALLTAGRIEQGIAIENKVQPWRNSQATLAGLNADVRFAEGVLGLRPGEADSLSICGMGAATIVRILQTAPARLPDRLIIQPNRCPEDVRQWALESNFHLIDEQLAIGHWPYNILVLQRSSETSDPAYPNQNPEIQVLFGPHLLKRRDPRWLALLNEEFNYLSKMPRLTKQATDRRDAIQKVLKM
ncbi:tRNA (adenine(22)-N(1))-methyltransferase [Roseimaritima multifibrata]|uniref:tRNA (Adenine(22)-N(1))-methyltransferase n=1 Tax=Roseimaritima multifibrata TaxID=1930274 RepID=A0A517MG91_9BACT|nr:class I SAM-dependent methyltransferase [Roseimaritima multifibrata]QDS93777.1 tRNA (adenine(22)-N(1))-methyltransferase [Roseimaritima multifibrata]